jgi:hypothetical protein
MRVQQKLASGLLVWQNIADAVRPVFFQTDHDEFLYATHGGTLFLVRFSGRVYALTCNHVFKDFPSGRLFVVNEKHAKKGSLPAHIKGIRYASNPTHAAVETDIGDVCLIEFSDENPAGFFGDSPYIIDENTVAAGIANHDLSVAGVLKEKTTIEKNTISSGYCYLQMRDGGPYGPDPILRRARAVFRDPEFTTVTGISGSPVFDEAAKVLSGMVVRGGMNGPNCDILYVDIFDIMKLLEAVSAGAESTFYVKTLEL